MFFPEKSQSGKEAKQICEECKVQQECLEWSQKNNERHGIWGGYSERQRLRMKNNDNATDVQEEAG